MSKYLDYSIIKEDFLPSWRQLYDKAEPFATNLLNLLPLVAPLPYPFQTKLIASYALTPSALASILPILIFYGQRGTGKSSLGQLISYLHGIQIHTGADTFAAIRNDLNDRRWKTIAMEGNDPAYPTIFRTIEVNTMMVWDDIDAKMLIEQPNIFRMLKSGYNKETDTISLADGSGENKRFNCFSPKICSTTTPIWGDSRFAELERRILVIKFGKAQFEPIVKLDNWNWHGFNQLFIDYWNSLDRAKNWLASRKKLGEIFSNNTRTTIILDIAATGLSTGIWKSTDEVKDYFSEYWSWYEEEIAYGDSALCGLLKKYIFELEQNRYSVIDLFGLSQDEIDPVALKKQIDSWNKQGMLEVTPTNSLVSQTMNYLGWRLIPGKWIKMK
ncbi:MAG: hypothetical protein DSM107014_12940 [Gomphosphaeria aponina SAG 52.96 = DSM 107014]|uniref:P-loop containing nucleoside triphosphate hydrolase protein n=1 Tax=Gomphosphaeria aponina SAG 52.96 = DSM 107014 TaxID=1521640 RepID=A0A941GXA7_9CHRO|nr:hypothetical protein [Gomphosphaeria aponina SAG 52.96 = DSM 107014]